MTYTGAMVLPQNAIRMNTNEMRYVDGGYTINLSTTTVERGVDLAVFIAGLALGGTSTIKQLINKIGSSKFVTKMVTAAAKFGIKKSFAEKAAKGFAIVTGFSIGSGVAYLLDKYDKSGKNGRVQF